MKRLKKSFSLIMAVALFCGNLTCNGTEAQAMTRHQVNAKITSLEKDIKALKQQKKTYEAKEKQESAGARYLLANVVSRTPFIVQDATSSYYWVTDGRYFDDYFAMVMGYVKLTGNYRTYNGITCAECNTVKVSHKSDSIQKKLSSKNKQLKKCKNSLKEKVTLEDKEIKAGKTGKISRTWKYGGTYNSLTWKTSNKEIATVDQNGRVTGHKAGTAIISAKTSLSGTISKCRVTVIEQKTEGYTTEEAEENVGNDTEQQPSVENKIVTIDFAPNNYEVDYEYEYGDIVYLSLHVGWQEDKGNEKIQISSSNESTAKIVGQSEAIDDNFYEDELSDSGRYEYKIAVSIGDPGTAIITAETESGLTAQCEIYVGW